VKNALECLTAMPPRVLWENRARLEGCDGLLARALTLRPVVPEMLPYANRLADSSQESIAVPALNCLEALR
jgi:hypothetical protein